MRSASTRQKAADRGDGLPWGLFAFITAHVTAVGVMGAVAMWAGADEPAFDMPQPLLAVERVQLPAPPMPSRAETELPEWVRQSQARDAARPWLSADTPSHQVGY